MTNPVRIVCLVAALSACANANKSPTNGLANRERLLMAIGGDEARLQQFEAAAQECGVTRISRASNGEASWVEVRGLAHDMFDERGAVHCAANWLRQNPEGLYFIGNEARQH